MGYKVKVQKSQRPTNRAFKVVMPIAIAECRFSGVLFYSLHIPKRLVSKIPFSGLFEFDFTISVDKFSN